MSRLIETLNANSNEFVLASDLRDIKNLLYQINTAVGGGDKDTVPDNIYLQYPESTAEMYLEANGKYERTVKFNSRITAIYVAIPAGCLLTLYSNGVPLWWFYNESGGLEFGRGIYVDNLKIVVTNANAASTVRWNCRIIGAK